MRYQLAEGICSSMIFGEYPCLTESISGYEKFNEDQWLKFLFLVSDSQKWLDEVCKGLIYQLPVEGKRKLLKKTYFLSATALAHILERHYHKIQRHPYTSKFTIPVVEILAIIRDSYLINSTPVKDSIYFQRVFDTGIEIGFDIAGNSTSVVTILTDAGGRIITAFPGELHSCLQVHEQLF